MRNSYIRKDTHCKQLAESKNKVMLEKQHPCMVPVHTVWLESGDGQQCCTSCVEHLALQLQDHGTVPFLRCLYPRPFHRRVVRSIVITRTHQRPAGPTCTGYLTTNGYFDRFPRSLYRPEPYAVCLSQRPGYRDEHTCDKPGFP